MTECESTQAADPKNSRGLCMSECQQDCNGLCAGATNMGQCRASCAHNCAKKCDKHCSDGDSAVLCSEKCGTVCTGTCNARSTDHCQVDCQSATFGSCETTVVEQCNQRCDTTGGAIFCDGQFLAASDVDACAAELASKLAIQVEVTAKASVKVNGTKVGCSMAASPQTSIPLAAMLVAAIAISATRRRRGQAR